jgi:hypothetical protein
VTTVPSTEDEQLVAEQAAELMKAIVTGDIAYTEWILEFLGPDDSAKVLIKAIRRPWFVVR